MKLRYHINWEGLRNVIRNPDIHPIQKTLLVNLLLYAGIDGNCYPSQKTLADDLGKSERYVRNELKKLKELGLLSWERGGFGRANAYSFSKELYVLNDNENRLPSSVNIGTINPFSKGFISPTNNNQIKFNQSNYSQSPLEVKRQRDFIPCNLNGCSGGWKLNKEKNTYAQCDCLIQFIKKKNGQ